MANELIRKFKILVISRCFRFLTFLLLSFALSLSVSFFLIIFVLIFNWLRKYFFRIFIIFLPPINCIFIRKGKSSLANYFITLETHHYNIASFWESRFEIMHLEKFGDKTWLREKTVTFIQFFNFILHVDMKVCESSIHFYKIFVIRIDNLWDRF